MLWVVVAIVLPATNLALSGVYLNNGINLVINWVHFSTGQLRICFRALVAPKTVRVRMSIAIPAQFTAGTPCETKMQDALVFAMDPASVVIVRVTV
jgi:hypothetical protein